jgi:hypothetical protein
MKTGLREIPAIHAHGIGDRIVGCGAVLHFAGGFGPGFNSGSVGRVSDDLLAGGVSLALLARARAPVASLPAGPMLLRQPAAMRAVDGMAFIPVRTVTGGIRRDQSHFGGERLA